MPQAPGQGPGAAAKEAGNQTALEEFSGLSFGEEAEVQISRRNTLPKEYCAWWLKI